MYYSTYSNIPSEKKRLQEFAFLTYIHVYKMRLIYINVQNLFQIVTFSFKSHYIMFLNVDKLTNFMPKLRVKIIPVQNPCITVFS